MEGTDEVKKPRKMRPQLYAVYYDSLHKIAKEMGYNLLIHGSMNRDMDLVAVPWVNEPKSHLELLNALSDFLGTVKYAENPENLGQFYMHSKLPGGRDSYVINLNRGRHHNGYFMEDEDAQYYIDISITPLA